MEQFFYLFSGFRWQDALDILLNSYILFRLYVLFRGTNVIRVLLSMCAIWAVSQTALPLGLIITNWAMQGVITVAALIIIIVFINDFSNVLQSNDIKSFLWGIPKHQFTTPLNIIVESVYELAEQKIGALMVLPLNNDIDNLVQGGVGLNAKLSREILVSIFWPDNPVHDGAAIIKDEQIISAGVILPLSKNKDLPSFFGTRHRAAAGLTELTDAIVLVVSEERGKISVFKENKTYNVHNRLALEKLLQKHTRNDSSKKGFRRQTLELVTAACISLFCVTGIWLTFSKGLETLATYEIPVEFINPHKKIQIISTSASNVKLLISGARPLIKSVKPEDINIKLNLSRAVVGANKLSITRDNIMLPPGIQLKKIEPIELEIMLDIPIKKDLPIQPYWTGKLAKGLVMKEARVIPDTISVSGGRLVLKNISTIFTEPIALDRLTESGVITTGLVLNPASLKLEHRKKVQVQYFIVKK